MISHAPDGYVCPFCVFVSGGSEELTWNRAADLVLRNDAVTAFVSPEWWPNNPGHVIVIPNDHYENLYDLPTNVGTRIHEASRDVALAMKDVYGCAGTSTRQHNEPAGYQEVWHYHLHVFPRFPGDELYFTRKSRVDEARRAEHAKRLRDRLTSEP
jgi:histidine triad (HIT) family protein